MTYWKYITKTVIDKTTNSATLSYSTVIVTIKSTEKRAHDKSRSSEEPDEVKVSGYPLGAVR